MTVYTDADGDRLYIDHVDDGAYICARAASVSREPTVFVKHEDMAKVLGDIASGSDLTVIEGKLPGVVAGDERTVVVRYKTTEGYSVYATQRELDFLRKSILNCTALLKAIEPLVAKKKADDEAKAKAEADAKLIARRDDWARRIVRRANYSNHHNTQYVDLAGSAQAAVDLIIELEDAK